jgi:phosphate starvation-inducible membrane PsiE
MPIETGCLAFFVYVQWWREQYRKFDPWIMRVLCTALLMTGVDTIIAIFLFDDGYGDYDVSIFVRPVVILALIRNLRQYSILFLRVVKDSYPMVAFTSVYVLYFSWIALIWFRGTL